MGRRPPLGTAEHGTGGGGPLAVGRLLPIMDLLVEVDVECPACGEYFPVTVDTSQGDYETTDDCAVCCRPMTVEVRCRPGEVLGVETSAA